MRGSGGVLWRSRGFMSLPTAYLWPIGENSRLGARRWEIAVIFSAGKFYYREDDNSREILWRQRSHRWGLRETN